MEICISLDTLSFVSNDPLVYFWHTFYIFHQPVVLILFLSLLSRFSSLFLVSALSILPHRVLIHIAFY